MPSQLLLRRRPARHVVWGVALCVGLSTAPRAHATLSIAAVDTATGEVGALGISCVGEALSLSEIMRLEPQVGVVIAQSYFYPEGRDEMMRLLTEGATPSDAVAAALNPSFDAPGPSSGASFRQYAALDLQGNVFAHTGGDSLPFADHKTAQVGTFSASVQGNALTGDEVLSALKAGFETHGGGIDQRLMAALEAVIDSEGGDHRCSPHPADAGYFEVHLSGLNPISGEVVKPGENAAPALLTEMRRLLPDPTDEKELADDKNTSPTSENSGCHLVSRHKLQGSWTPWALLALLTAVMRRARRAHQMPPLLRGAHRRATEKGSRAANTSRRRLPFGRR